MHRPGLRPRIPRLDLTRRRTTRLGRRILRTRQRRLPLDTRQRRLTLSTRQRRLTLSTRQRRLPLSTRQRRLALGTRQRGLRRLALRLCLRRLNHRALRHRLRPGYRTDCILSDRHHGGVGRRLNVRSRRRVGPRSGDLRRSRVTQA